MVNLISTPLTACCCVETECQSAFSLLKLVRWWFDSTNQAKLKFLALLALVMDMPSTFLATLDKYLKRSSWFFDPH